ncbi:MAG: putative baseplate assembly protein, partial [Anaerolineales bacterium]|nr:putative baseplate assembly protein [Anaerolineales bacterium]
MSLAAPKLDDRTFQQLVDEAKKRIPHYTKEWTDHNVSDPGVTLIELFAWLTETTLYRLNRLPDRHYIKFMEMLGLKLKAPVPARVPVTFWLTAAANSEVVVPAGTEVASTQTETEPSIVFTTERPLTVLPPELSAVCTRVAAPDKKKRLVEGPVLRILQAGLKKPFPVFTQPQPEEEDALYLGFQNDLSHQVLRLDMEWEEAKGIGIEPSMPPLIWEASTGDNEQRWQPCDVEIDTTEGLNKNGRVQLHLPQMGMYPVDKQRMFWVRVRVRRISPAEKRDGMQPYAESPKLIRVNVSGWGGTIMATHSQTIRNETIGQSDGSAGQRFHVKRAPLLARTPDEHLMVFIEGEKPHEWAEVDDFANSGPNSCHYLLDSVSGELRFGPAIRQPDGTIK